MKHKIQSQIKNLDSLFDFAKEQVDDEVKAHLARYLCIRTSGLMESSIKLIVKGYVDKKCPIQIQNYVNSNVGRLNNVESDKIGNLLCMFCPEWKEDFEVFISGQKESSLNSVVGIRHTLAHNFNNPGITIRQLQSYWDDIKTIIWFLHKLLK